MVIQSLNGFGLSTLSSHVIVYLEFSLWSHDYVSPIETVVHCTWPSQTVIWSCCFIFFMLKVVWFGHVFLVVWYFFGWNCMWFVQVQVHRLMGHLREICNATVHWSLRGFKLLCYAFKFKFWIISYEFWICLMNIYLHSSLTNNLQLFHNLLIIRNQMLWEGATSSWFMSVVVKKKIGKIIWFWKTRLVIDICYSNSNNL